jgi:hypothetical protein
VFRTVLESSRLPLTIPKDLHGSGGTVPGLVVDVSYAGPQAHGIVNVALHREYSPRIVYIFSQGRKYLYHV